MTPPVIVSLLLVGLAAALPAAEYRASERAFWSFQPLQRVEPPKSDSAWAAAPIDAFIHAKLRQEGLEPAPQADRAALIRRAAFDVTGLPPTPEEVAAFVKDDSPDAWEKVVDRLLAGPHYGEQQARQWLDVVRYAETEGFEYDRYLPGLWRYRDYVIRAFNDDLPYDRFIREQLAGDEMAADDARTERGRETLTAAGFHRLGAVRRNAGNQEVASSRNEILTERTDIIGSAFLAMTVGCARCHDHMFDPIRQVDYYRLQAYLGRAYETDVVLDGGPSIDDWRKQTKEIAGKMKKLRAQIKLAQGEERAKLQAEHDALEAQLPEPPPTLATVRNDPEYPDPIHVLDRGDHTRPLQAVNPRPLGVLLPEDAPTLPPDVEAPRSKLADWIADPNNPLTPRVMVNRIWLGYFNRGIVNTPNDFGFMGERPSHPELLDYLAGELIADGWRLKPLHRRILLSNSYRQAAKNPAMETLGMEKDAANSLLWRGPARRLTAEEIRDAMLAVSGKLNPRRGGRSVMAPVEEALVDLLYDPTQWRVTEDAGEHDRRSIYLIAKRNLRLPFMEVFDQPALLTTCGRRETSTHAPQSLELLNGDLSNRLAAAFAERLRRESGGSRERQIDRAYRLAAGRPPSARERAAAQAFLAEQPLREFALAMFNLNAFLYLR